MKSHPKRLVFFLGGQDLEMATIRHLLEQEAPDRFYDKGLGWGACASTYAEELWATLKRDLIPVLVELKDDLQPHLQQIILVDHHGEQAGQHAPTSLHQVFELLELPPTRWSRWFELVAANDRGYIPALVAVGATAKEIAAVRAADRAAQGITTDQEAAAEAAIHQLEDYANGQLIVVRLPHNRTATVTDRLQPELGGPGYANLLVISPQEVNFYGSGKLVQALVRTYPGGWYGGALPEYGYWGRGEPLPPDEELLGWLERAASKLD